MLNRIDQLMLSMMAHEAPDAERIQHFIKVHDFARLIGQLEGLDPAVQEVLEAAAVVHDIGIHPAERKYGRSDGPLQELEGPPMARELLSQLGWEEAAIDRVAFLVGHHHTYTEIDGIDYQILVEADFLVNLFEGGRSAEAQREVYRRIFRTESVKRLFRTMFSTGAEEQEP